MHPHISYPENVQNVQSLTLILPAYLSKNTILHISLCCILLPFLRQKKKGNRVTSPTAWTLTNYFRERKQWKPSCRLKMKLPGVGEKVISRGRFSRPCKTDLILRNIQIWWRNPDWKQMLKNSLFIFLPVSIAVTSVQHFSAPSLSKRKGISTWWTTEKQEKHLCIP